MSKPKIESAITGKRRPWWRSALLQTMWSMAFGSMFLFAQSYALSVQNIEINSSLGQPLDAIVHITAAPGERLSATCITVRPGVDSALPAIRGVQLSLSRNLNPGTLRLRTTSPMREPMSEIVVQVSCPDAPQIQRSFLVMLDPAPAEATRPAYAQSSSPAAATAQGVQNSTAIVSSSDPRIRVADSTTSYRGNRSVMPGATYRVANGESLSTIAARVEGRQLGTVWSWAATIQKANPQAFLNGDPNNLMAGYALYIPNSLERGLSTADLRTGARTVNAPADVRSNSIDELPGDIESRVRTILRTSTVIDVDQTPAVTATNNTLAAAQTGATGALRVVPRSFMLATRFSRLSIARLEQRKAGLLQKFPGKLPNFVTDTKSGTVPETPEMGSTPMPALPVDEKPAAATPSASASRRIPWLGALGGFGLLLLSFLTGGFFATRRAQRKIEEAASAGLHEQRFRQRVESDHRDVTEQVLGAGSGMVVSEKLPEPTITDAEALVDVDAALASDAAEANSHLDFDETIVELGEDHVHLSLGADHNLTSMDLDLLERDYLQQGNLGLEDIANAGKGHRTGEDNQTELIDTRLDLELPQNLDSHRGAKEAADSIDFDPEIPSLDFDLGTTEAVDDNAAGDSFDVAEAGAALDAELEALGTDDTTVAASTEGLAYDSVDDEHLTATSTRDAEEFYHLETSSIMNVDELSFEKELEDETKILTFRQRSKKTGTDDSGSDNE